MSDRGLITAGVGLGVVATGVVGWITPWVVAVGLFIIVAGLSVYAFDKVDNIRFVVQQ